MFPKHSWECVTLQLKTLPGLPSSLQVKAELTRQPTRPCGIRSPSYPHPCCLFLLLQEWVLEAQGPLLGPRWTILNSCHHTQPHWGLGLQYMGLGPPFSPQHQAYPCSARMDYPLHPDGFSTSDLCGSYLHCSHVLTSESSLLRNAQTDHSNEAYSSPSHILPHSVSLTVLYIVISAQHLHLLISYWLC